MTVSAVPTSTRLLNVLNEHFAAGLIDFIGGSGYTVRVTSRHAGEVTATRSGSTEQMWSWLNGFNRGRQLPGRDGWWSTGGIEAAVDRLDRARQSVAQFREVLVDPSLSDQLRVQVLTAMERQGLTAKDLAERIGRTPQTVRDALTFGVTNPRIGSITLFDTMLRTLGARVRISHDPVRADVDVVGLLGVVRPEPLGFTRMRALVIAVERRLVDGVSPTSVQRARRAREFEVAIAGHAVVRRQETLLYWLCGVADGAGDAVAMQVLTTLGSRRGRGAGVGSLTSE